MGGLKKMKVRADFNFSDLENKIGKCIGYVIGEFTATKEGGLFRPDDVKIIKLVCKNPVWEKIEELAIKNCTVLY